MQIHELKPKTKRKGKKRIGRGGKKGTYSGKGNKGQKSRSGSRLKPIVRGWIKRYPKLRGYNFNIIKDKPVSINLKDLEKAFEANGEINPNILVEKRIIRRINSKTPLVKILSKGEITKPLIISNCIVSKSAQEKIEKAGGQIKK